MFQPPLMNFSPNIPIGIVARTNGHMSPEKAFDRAMARYFFWPFAAIGLSLAPLLLLRHGAPIWLVLALSIAGFVLGMWQASVALNDVGNIYEQLLRSKR
jgi:hypothetical protein